MITAGTVKQLHGMKLTWYLPQTQTRVLRIKEVQHKFKGCGAALYVIQDSGETINSRLVAEKSESDSLTPHTRPPYIAVVVTHTLLSHAYHNINFQCG